MAPPLKQSLLKGSAQTLSASQVGSNTRSVNYFGTEVDEGLTKTPKPVYKQDTNTGSDAHAWMEEVFEKSAESRALAANLHLPTKVKADKPDKHIRAAKENWKEVTAPKKAIKAAISELIAKYSHPVGKVVAHAPDLVARQGEVRHLLEHVGRELYRCRPKRVWIGAEGRRTFMGWLELIWYLLWYLSMYALSVAITTEFIMRVNADAEDNLFLIYAPAGLTLAMSAIVMGVYKYHTAAQDFIDKHLYWLAGIAIVLAGLGVAQLMTSDGTPQLITDFNNVEAIAAMSAGPTTLEWAGYFARLSAEVLGASFFGVVVMKAWNKHGRYILERDPAEKDLKRLQKTLDNELSLINKRVAEARAFVGQIFSESRAIIDDVIAKMGAKEDLDMKLVDGDLEACHDILSKA